MNRLNSILLIVFSVQLILTGSLYFGNQNTVEAGNQTALMSLQQQQINKLLISEREDSQVSLQKSDGRWILDDYFQLPIVNGKLDTLLSKLQQTMTGWPVATTESSHERFKVTDNKYNKKVVLSSSDGQTETLYLGTSPGFRQLHLRRAGENNVYAVKLNSFDFPTKNSEWLDKGLLQISDDINQLSVNDYVLKKEGDSWSSENHGDDPDGVEIGNLVDTLMQLRVQKAEVKTPTEVNYQISVESADRSYRYQLFKDAETYFVKRDDLQPAFEISKAEFEKFTSLDVAKLVKKTGPEEQQDISNNEQDANADVTSESNS